MRIKIISIDRTNVIEVSDAALGYNVTFECPIVSGEAVLVPYSGREDSLIDGAVLSVETSQEAVTEFKILTNIIAHSIKPLSKSGDFFIVGSVDLNGDDEVFYIDAGGFSFMLDIDETKGIIPQKGDIVEFIVHGLVLWDENI